VSDRSNIEAAKRALPLPDLLRKLGFNPPEGDGNMPSPFAPGRPQKTPSFSIFQRGEDWGWCDRSGGVETKGDEITLLEKLEGLALADAIARYVDLAGVENARPASPGRGPGASGKGIAARKSARPASSGLDWAAAVLKFGDDQTKELARWRGISPEFIAWLRNQALIGLCKESTAFPVHGTDGRVIAANIRPKRGRWFYWPKGAGCHPLIIGNPATATKTMVFESQWDAFAVMDAAGWHKAAPDGWAVLITRGASPTSRIQPVIQKSLLRKSLICREALVRKRPKVAVVKTYPIHRNQKIAIMGCCHVLTQHRPQEKRQASPLLEHCRDPARGWRQSAPAPRALSW
jgi:hypothetical protein